MSRLRGSLQLGHVKVVLETARRGLAGIGLPGIEPIAGIPLLIIEYYESINADRKAMTELSSSLNLLVQAILRPFDEARRRGDLDLSVELVARIRRLEDKLTMLRLSIEQFTSWSNTKRFWNRDKISSTLSNVANEIAEAITQSEVEGQITAELLLRCLDKRAITAGQRSSLQLLQHADGSSWNPERTCLPKTRQDVISDIVQFAHSQHPTLRIYLLIGVAGCGKSMIAHSVCQALYDSDPRILGSAFFFSLGADGRRSSHLLASTIAYELGRFHPALADSISVAIEDDPGIFSASFARQFRKLVLEPIHASSAIIAHPIVIVIDALDERENDHDMDDELRAVFIRDCATLPPGCQIIITSRPTRITASIGCQPHVQVREVDLMESRNRDDVALFARHSLSIVAEEQGLERSWPGEGSTIALIDKAGGLFVWIATACKFLRSCINPVEQLRRLLDDRPFHDLTEKMDQIYITVLSACPWNDDDFASNYRLFMGTILALRTPLTPRAIDSLLGLEISIVRTLRPLSPVLTGLEADGRPLQIIHDSFRDFITRQHPGGQRFQVIDIEEPNCGLAIRILLLLNHEIPSFASFTQQISTILSNNKRQNIPIPPSGVSSEGLLYSCQYLAAHLDSVKRPTPILLNALKQFVMSNLLSWILLCASKGPFCGVTDVFNKITRISPATGRCIVKKSIAQYLSNLYRQLNYMGRLDEAHIAITESVSLYRQSVEGSETSVAIDAGLALSLRNLSSSFYSLGCNYEALLAARESLDLRRQLALKQPLTFVGDIADATRSMSACLYTLGRHEEALGFAHEALEIRRQQADDAPSLEIADLLQLLSACLSALSRHGESLLVCGESVEMHRLLVEQHRTEAISGLANSLRGLCNCLAALGRHDEALSATQEALHLRRQLAKERPSAFTASLADSQRSLSACFSNVYRHDEALIPAREALALRRGLAKEGPVIYNCQVADSLEVLARCLSVLGRDTEAQAALSEAVELRRQITLGSPSPATVSEVTD